MKDTLVSQLVMDELTSSPSDILHSVLMEIWGQSTVEQLTVSSSWNKHLDKERKIAFGCLVQGLKFFSDRHFPNATASFQQAEKQVMEKKSEASAVYSRIASAQIYLTAYYMQIRVKFLQKLLQESAESLVQEFVDELCLFLELAEEVLKSLHHHPLLESSVHGYVEDSFTLSGKQKRRRMLLDLASFDRWILAVAESVDVVRQEQELKYADKLRRATYMQSGSHTRSFLHIIGKQTLLKNDSGVNDVKVVDVNTVVSLCNARFLKIWDLKDAECQRTLKGHTCIVTCFAVLDDHRIVSGSRDRTLRIWNVRNGKCEKVLKGHVSYVTCVTTVNTQTVISGSSSIENCLRVWNLKDDSDVKVLKGHTSGIACVEVIDQNTAMSGSFDGSVRVWDINAGECLRVFEGHYSCVDFTGVFNKQFLVSGDSTCSMRVWDLHSGESKELKGRSGTLGLNDAAVIQSNYVLCAGDDHSLQVFNHAGKCIQKLKGHTGTIHDIAVLNNETVVTGSEDKTMRVWNVSTGECLKVLKGHKDCVNRIVVLNANTILSGSSDRTMRIWRVDLHESVALVF